MIDTDNCPFCHKKIKYFSTSLIRDCDQCEFVSDVNYKNNYSGEYLRIQWKQKHYSVDELLKIIKMKAFL